MKTGTVALGKVTGNGIGASFLTQDVERTANYEVEQNHFHQDTLCCTECNNQSKTGLYTNYLWH